MIILGFASILPLSFSNGPRTGYFSVKTGGFYPRSDEIDKTHKCSIGINTGTISLDDTQVVY